MEQRSHLVVCRDVGQLVDAHVDSLARYGTSEKRPPCSGRTVAIGDHDIERIGKADLQVGMPLDDLDRRRQIVTVERRKGPSATGEIAQQRKLGRDAFARRDEVGIGSRGM